MVADEPRGAEPVVGASLWQSEIFRRVLAGERLRNSRQIAAFRCVALAVLFALTLAFLALAPGFVTAAIGLTTVYLAGAIAVLAVRRRSARGARFDALLVPLLDMPMVALISQEVIRALHAAGYSRDAANLATFAPVYFALLIVLTALSLDVAQIAGAAAVGIVLQTLLMRWAQPDNTFMLVQGGLILLFAAAIGLYARARTVGLVRSYAERQRAVERLGRYFSPQVAERLAQQADEMGSGESREVTVLFADLRDFTALSETLAGPAVVAVLNEFLAAMVDEIFACGGTLDKYMGDGLMAYFGAPADQSDHADRGVRCALAMQAALERLNAVRARRGATPLRMGVGVHSGRVVLGDIGTPRRRDYTAVGDTVNVAARIEQLTKQHSVPILVSEETRSRVRQEVAFTPAEAVAVKGKSVPLRTYVPAMPAAG